MNNESNLKVVTSPDDEVTWTSVFCSEVQLDKNFKMIR